MFRHNKRKLVYLFVLTLIVGFCGIQKRYQNSALNSSDKLFSYDEYNCGCPRMGKPVFKTENETSFCSIWSTSRGPQQNVIAYTIYGDYKIKQIKKQYYDQIEERLNEASLFYEGWILRLYHNASLKDVYTNDMICKLYCKFSNFDPCQVQNLYPPKTWLNQNLEPPKSVEDQNSLLENIDGSEDSSFTNYEVKVINYILKISDAIAGRGENNFLEQVTNNSSAITSDTSISSFGHKEVRRKPFEKLLIPKMWRFLPMADPFVSNFLVRDVDSLILEREVSAVRQWLENSTALIHSMRDHPSHNGPILAGLWGGARKRDEATMTYLFRKMLKWPPNHLWDYDQILLRRVVWPQVLDNVLVHDSYHCHNPFLKAKTKPQPFPTKRQGRLFVSWGPTRGPTELKSIVPCPEKCRPNEHREWTYC